jgi:uncharacterized protein with PQ loop repeat
MSRELKKTKQIVFKTTPDVAEKIIKYQSQKSIEIGVSISKNMAIELLLADGFTVNNIK